MRVTHALDTGFRAVELAPDVYGIESNDGHTVARVQSAMSLARFLVAVEPIASSDALRVTGEQIAEAQRIADLAPLPSRQARVRRPGSGPAARRGVDGLR